ncbi:MAG: GSU2403 family nucleotidyltransferase fold protein, partial [Firmicutes bacterium]|nr:GSU2403 family nucleotidyltransferase fold protein [Bacillota bacterium]
MTNIQKDEMVALLKVFDNVGLLPYVVLVGSWAEYFYQEMLEGFIPSIRTTDIDFYFPRGKKPATKIDVFTELRSIGYLYEENRGDESSRFVKVGGFEIEFLTHPGRDERKIFKIEYADINAICLDKLDIFNKKGTIVSWASKRVGVTVNLPSPATYIIQKLVINADRTP